ncbi:ankyrin repeat domain-containing protein [Rhizobiaceae bacterium n13]|uniref:Ankyrin repeat domain-containing protein n=1 Tax=Ferirhizobium litorale TaxID=2927786 RepID=A0AAE3QCA6_9HYPH|nr:ankyrin repeat domain-containing protein [Fererhizobium litorale]MDI7864838.1 ankyrin repeat domain-containing protein [Fererhizobium litorale]MDI7923152.1 ankyrin repeat domain-containing protein [Fererhizobium litorale]
MHAKLTLLLFCSCLFPLALHAGAIHDAAKKGDVTAIIAALDAGADVNASDGSATPLYFAVKRGRLAAARLLIEHGADVNAPTQWGPALMAAVTKGRIELIRLLLENGADPNAQLDSETALHIAAGSGCLDCVKALVEAGADVNARTKDTKTPIHLARLKGHRDVADYLMAHGVVLPKPAPISARLASADVEKGRAYFAGNCASCHKVEPQGAAKTGPNLWGVVGRAKASLQQISYSETLRAWGGVWSYEDLNIYLSGPMLTTPGVYMETPGIPDEADRANVIAYLRTRSDTPPMLP